MDISVLINPRFEKIIELQRAITLINAHQIHFRLELVQTALVPEVDNKKVIDQNRLFAIIERARGCEPTCVIVRNPLKYDLFSDYRRNAYIFTTGDSAASYAPLPMTLYAVFMLACGLANLACELPQEVSELCAHDPDIGCISDYNSDKKGIRFSMMNAHICGDCKTLLREHGIRLDALDATEQIIKFVRQATRPYLEAEPREKKVAQMIAQLNRILPGNAGAGEYHQFVIEALAMIFHPSLIKPKKEGPLDHGRKRVDIIFNNKARSGFFYDLVTKHLVKCGYVYVECKNYSKDLANAELDQLLGRLNDIRGMFGMIVCRHVEDKELVQQRCKDAAKSERKFVMVLEDNDIKSLLGFHFEQNSEAIDNHMDDLFRPLVM